MVCTCDHQSRIRNALRDLWKCLHQQFQALVCSPVSDSENPLMRISTTGEIGLRRRGKDPMCAKVNVLPSILIDQCSTITGQQYGKRVRHQEDPRGDGTGDTKQPLLPDVCVREIDMLHQMVESDVRVIARQSSESRSAKPD